MRYICLLFVPTDLLAFVLLFALCFPPSPTPAPALAADRPRQSLTFPCLLTKHFLNPYVTFTWFFFLWFGRSRSKARSLHEKKLLVRKLLHGRRWSHAAWQIITTKTQTKNTRQDADPPARFASHHPKDSKANSERGKSPTRNNHNRFAKDTVVKTHCVAMNSKPCSKRINSHPET